MTSDDVPFAPRELEPVSMQGMLQPPRANDVDRGTAGGPEPECWMSITCANFSSALAW